MRLVLVKWKWGCFMLEFPFVYALVCFSTGTIEYTSDRLTSVEGFYNSLPEDVRESFGIIEYRATKQRK